MKRLIIMTALVLVSLSAFAQPRAIGIRAGYGWDVSYQHTLGNNFLEADLGISGALGFNLSAIYDFKLLQPKWTNKGIWCIYAGPGATFQAKAARENRSSYTSILIGGQVGLEYAFEGAPINLSLDWRPMFGPMFSNGTTTFCHTLSSIALAIRYRF